MSKYLGDFSATTVIDFKFTTFRPSTGAPFTLAGSPVISVYKDDSITQSTAGVTLTVDFDSVTGLHHVQITTAADGTFYANGGEFECVITAGTVDSVSVVGSCIGRFTLRSQAALYATTAGNTLDVNANGEAGIDWANVGNPTTTLGLSNTTIANVTVGSISSGAITAASIATDAITAAKIADSAITIRLSSDATASKARLIAGTTASDVWGALLASYTTNNTFGQRVLRSTTSQSECAVTGSNHIASDVHELQAGVISSGDFAADAIDATVLSADASNEIADALLNRNVGGGSSAGRLVKEALYALRNKSEIVGALLSVYDASDGLSWTAVVASSSSADPVTGIDP